jgi:hypothetical protein
MFSTIETLIAATQKPCACNHADTSTNATQSDIQPARVRSPEAVDLGYGDDAHFDALATKLNAVQKAFGELPSAAQTAAVARLTRVRTR